MIRKLVVVVVPFALILGTLSAGAQEVAARPQPWRCIVPPIEACFTHRGRLSAQNGIAYMLWLVGTHRIMDVTDTEMPGIVSKYLDMASPDHADVFGQFEVCPLEPDTPSRMRKVCIGSASRLVVQDRERTRPAIRLKSTWP